jgi:radical SAM protein with 4Fe4S-binding SPASM domain
MHAAVTGKSWAQSIHRQTLLALGRHRRLKRHNSLCIRTHERARDAKLSSFPSTLQIEHSTYCNLRCRMCSIIRPSRQRAQAHLTMDVVEKLRPVLPHVRDIALNGGGEPFLVHDIERFLDLFGTYGVRISTITNGTLITDRLARVIGRHFSSLTISIDGATRDTYEMIRENSRFDHLLRAIDVINRHRRPGLQLKINFVIMLCNVHELPELVRFARDHEFAEVHATWMVAFDDLPWTHAQQPARDPARVNACLADARRAALECGIVLVVPPDLAVTPAMPSATGDGGDDAGLASYGRLLTTQRVTGFCHLMYDRAMVLVDGRVKPCCHSHEIVGSLQEQSFEEIWNGPAYQSLRSAFASGVLPGSCRSCNFLRSGELGSGQLIERGAG